MTSAAAIFIAGCSSSKNRSIDNTTLEVISDCVTPTVDMVIHTFNGNSTSAVDYTQLGFPSGTVHLGQDVTGTFFNGTTSVTRTCTQTYGADNTDKNNKYIYSCSDNGDYACSITLISQ
jgi:hypothetical protein